MASRGFSRGAWYWDGIRLTQKPAVSISFNTIGIAPVANPKKTENKQIRFKQQIYEKSIWAPNSQSFMS